jgi:hypothetical protein
MWRRLLIAVTLRLLSKYIELLPQGAKVVSPHLLTRDEIADFYSTLMQPIEARAKGFDKVVYLASRLSASGRDKLLCEQVRDLDPSVRLASDTKVQFLQLVLLAGGSLTQRPASQRVNPSDAIPTRPRWR